MKNNILLFDPCIFWTNQAAQQAQTSLCSDNMVIQQSTQTISGWAEK